MANDGDIRLVTYAGSTVTPLDDAVVYDAAIGSSGIMHGCDVSIGDGTLRIHIAPGHGVIRGRKFTVYDTTIDVPGSTTSSNQTGNVLIVLNLAGGVDPISFEAHMPAVDLSSEGYDESSATDRDTNNPNYDSSRVWKMELCRYTASATAITAMPKKTVTTIDRVTRIKNKGAKAWRSGALELDLTWLGFTTKTTNNVEYYSNLNVNSATKLITPRTFQLTGDLTTDAVAFDGSKNVTLKTKFSYAPSTAYHAFSLKPKVTGVKDGQLVEVLARRLGPIVIAKVQTDTFTGSQWREMDAEYESQGAGLIDSTSTTLSKFLPALMMRQATPLLNGTVASTTYWVRFSVTTAGRLQIKTNAPKNTVSYNASCIMVWPADGYKWIW